VELATSPTAGAELRVFGARDIMRSELAAAVTNWRRPGLEAAVRANLLEAACAAFFFLIASAVLAWMVADALERTVPVGASSSP